MWFRDYHIDGLRLDAIHAIVDLSAVHILEELARRTAEWSAHLGRHLVLIAESDLNDPRVIQPREVGGYGLDAQWCDDMHHALHVTLTGEHHSYYSDFHPMDDLALSLRRPYVYAGQQSTFRGRTHGRSPGDVSGRQFVTYLQNHDQLGNRGLGERIGHLSGSQAAMIGAALTVLSPYIPMLFQGEEWGASSPFQYFVDFSDEPELAQAVRKGRQQEFSLPASEVPDPNDLWTFLCSKLNWGERNEPEHQALLRWYQQLIQLRRSLPALTSGRLDLVETRSEAEAGWLVMERGPLAVLVNFSKASCRVPGRWKAYRTLLASVHGTKLNDDGADLPPQAAVIIVHRDAT
ncbi:DUF3459 domain-containing protein [Planctomyces sp. SH-PL14]|uniref:DUF3459 domain-containing protein n=1 Tax=Planctomyces sp. SH-PL14 TaxID=1632864 RepID=UPI00078D46ED|nr:DUF3459 domain-containing protein [Planctomyces sp. SH-PL14]AMV17390.1 Malto-oligosyltrehalose trehalohydrolase [Planctomyces sp. SH-PL14]